MKGRTPAILLLVPALILAVAAVHALRVATLDQSSWKGGGFGMFATYDHESTRAVVVLVEHGDGLAHAVLQSGDRDTLARLRALPRDAGAADLARIVLARDLDATRVVVEVRGRDLDGTTLSFPVLARAEVAR